MIEPEMCPSHPTQDRAHCACSAGMATFYCSGCGQTHGGLTCGWSPDDPPVNPLDLPMPPLAGG